MSEDLIVLREILQRELETINAYEKMLDRLTEPALREIVAHVTDEEREHVSEMYHLILARDVRQRDVDASNHATAGVAAGDAVGAKAVSHAAHGAAEVVGLSPGLISPPAQGAPRAPAPLLTGAPDPVPPPPPVFPDGAWSVGKLKGGR